MLLGGYPRLQQRTHAASGHLKFAAQNEIDGLGISDVFLLEDAPRERVLVIGIEHWHSLLNDDGSMIEVLIHKMHGAAADFGAVIQGLPLRVQAGKGRQQRGMNVEDPLRKLLYEP